MSNLAASQKEAELTDSFRGLADLVEACKENANRGGEHFNIFAILGIQRDENRTHSRYLAELLSPAGRHGEGAKFLNAFVNDVLGLALDVRDRVKVTRELATEDQRRVDIVVESPDLIIGIEVKIDAGDQKAQLHDYYTALKQRAKSRKKAVLVYLTLDGKAPSTYSLKDLEQENVHCLSFEKDIRQWIDTCASLSKHKPELSYALIQYKRLLENLTGAGASMTALIADKLANNRDDLETALAVEKALPKAKAMVMLRFWEELSNAMANAFDVTPTVYGGKNLSEISHSYFDVKLGGKHVGVKHTVGDLNGKKLCLYVNLYNAIHYGLRIDSESGLAAPQQGVRNQLRQKLNDGNAVADKDLDWLVCYYHNPAPSQEPIILNFDKFTGSVLDLMDEDKRQTIIGQMVDHQVNLIKEAKTLLETSVA
nr:PD-(D/E)XK nuclease family protein [uncultured Halomonas sp.]